MITIDDIWDSLDKCIAISDKWPDVPIFQKRKQRYLDLLEGGIQYTLLFKKDRKTKKYI